jgi:hypothetical protein
MKWEELNTPEAVLAAFAARLRVEFTCESDGWIVPTQKGRFEPAEMMRMGCRYRALIEEPAEPLGRDAEGPYTDANPFDGGSLTAMASGRDAEGVEGLADCYGDVMLDANGRKSWEFDGHGLHAFARRLRPQVDEGMAPEPADIAVESFPSVPTGGMSVRMPAGVKVTHKPTGCTVTVSHYRSQHHNRAAAIRALTAALGEAGHG